MFIVLMRRYGEYDGHCYVIGSWKSKKTAVKEGKKESKKRGNKYESELLVTDRRGYVIQKLDQAGLPSGKARDCKPHIGGSIPPPASKTL